jgi:hypothetical protein
MPTEAEAIATPRPVLAPDPGLARMNVSAAKVLACVLEAAA